MRRLFFAVIAAVTLIAAPSINWAAPLIIATNVVSACVDLPGGSVSTVTVTLNGTTHSFFNNANASLYYHFTPNPTGVAVTLPSPSSYPNPVFVGEVQAGIYKLAITDKSGAGGSSSPAYAVTVPSYVIQKLGARRQCPLPKPVEQKLPSGVKPHVDTLQLHEDLSQGSGHRIN